MPDISLILDGAMIILLLVTIGFAITLNRRLARLRHSKQDMERLIAELSRACSRAEAAIQQLRRASEEGGRKLREAVASAETLRQDLAFLNERGTVLADRLEDAVRTARDGPREAPAPRPAGVQSLAEAVHQRKQRAQPPEPPIGAPRSFLGRAVDSARKATKAQAKAQDTAQASDAASDKQALLHALRGIR